MDPAALCADTTAAWHASWLDALDLRWERRERVWRAVDSPPFIYWSAITLERDASEADLCDARGTVCDSRSLLDLAACGFGERDRDGSGEGAREPSASTASRRSPRSAGRGHASALTRALIDPALPAVLSPSSEAENLYRRLGFEQVGGLRQWHRG